MNSVSRASDRWSTLLMERSSSLRSWQTTRMAPGKVSSSFISHALAGRSRWLVGSSRIMVSGPWKRIRIRSTRRRWPPERLSMSSSSSSWRSTEPVGQASHRGLGLVAAVLPELLLEVGEEGDVLGGGVLGHLGPGLAEGVVQDVEAPAGEHVGEADGLESEAVGLGHLGQVAVRPADGRTARRAHVATRLADDDGDEGGLAGAVPSDEADLLSGADHERGVAQEGAVADLDGEGGADDHGSGGGPTAAGGRVPDRSRGVRRGRRHQSPTTPTAGPVGGVTRPPGCAEAPSSGVTATRTVGPSAQGAGPAPHPGPAVVHHGPEGDLVNGPEGPPVGHAQHPLGAQGADLLDGRRTVGGHPEPQPRFAAEPLVGAQHQGLVLADDDGPPVHPVAGGHRRGTSQAEVLAEPVAEGDAQQPGQREPVPGEFPADVVEILGESGDPAVGTDVGGRSRACDRSV